MLNNLIYKINQKIIYFIKRVRREIIFLEMKRIAISIGDPSIAHYNNKLPLVKHLEELQNKPRTSNPGFTNTHISSFKNAFDNVSPIPRHDLSEIEKLNTIDNFVKRHPNPKMEGSPYYKYTTTSNALKKYEMLFTRISFPKPDQDDL